MILARVVQIKNIKSAVGRRVLEYFVLLWPYINLINPQNHV